MPAYRREAHDARWFESDGSIDRAEGYFVEMLVGLALIVIAVLMIVFIIRTVQANMGRA